MRRVVAAAGGALLLSAMPALAQETVSAAAPATTVAPEAAAMSVTTDRLNTVTVAPLSLLGGNLGLEYERVVAPKVTLFAGPSLTFSSGLLSFLGVSSFGFGAHAGGRYFLTGDAPSGLWLGPQLSFNAATVSATASSGADSQDISMSTFGFNALAMVGYTWITDSGVDISIGAGGGYGSLSFTGNTSGSAGSAEFPVVEGSFFSGAVRAAVGFAF